MVASHIYKISKLHVLAVSDLPRNRHVALLVTAQVTVIVQRTYIKAHIK